MTQETYLNRFTQVAQYMVGLTQAKNADYAGHIDAFKNFQLIEILTEGRVSTAAGILVRLTDKLQRVANLLARPAQVMDERIEDTLLDNAVYSIILYLWLTKDQAELKLAGTMPVATQTGPPELPQMEADPFEALKAKVDAGISLTPIERLQLLELCKERLGTTDFQGAQ
jgi:hypothetical protein